MNKIEQYKNIENKINKAEANRDKEEVIRLAKEYDDFSGSIDMSIYMNFKDYNSAKKICKDKNLLATGLTLALKERKELDADYFFNKILEVRDTNNENFRDLSHEQKIRRIIDSYNLKEDYILM